MRGKESTFETLGKPKREMGSRGGERRGDQYQEREGGIGSNREIANSGGKAQMRD